MSWDQSKLEDILKKQENWVVEPEGNCLSITKDGDLSAYVYIGEQQIVVELALFPHAAVKDPAALNDLILRSHQLVPLTAVCLKQIGDLDYYVAFGALSTDSKESVILEEINTLFANAEEFLELYGEFVSQETL
jgi:uncharacterized protein YjfI (DUF2170 family)